VIIELGFSPDQSRQINHLADGQSFGDGQPNDTERGGLVVPGIERHPARREHRPSSTESDEVG
jgi:hypothetical protein